MQSYKLFLLVLLIGSVVAEFYIEFIKSFTVLNTAISSFAIVLIPICLILLFMSSDMFNTWKHFFVVWVVISAIAIWLAPSYRTGSWLDIGPDKKLVAMYMAGIFFLISLILIARGWWKARKVSV